MNRQLNIQLPYDHDHDGPRLKFVVAVKYSMKYISTDLIVKWTYYIVGLPIFVDKMFKSINIERNSSKYNRK